MIARARSRLAWTLQAQVPDLCIRDTVGDPLLQNAVADPRMMTCRQAGVADEDARVIGEVLAGSRYGWCGRDADLDARVSQAQAALNRGAGGSGGPVRPQRATGTVLSEVAIAQMMRRSWASISRPADGRAPSVTTETPWCAPIMPPAWQRCPGAPEAMGAP